MDSPSRPSSWIQRPSSSQSFDPYHDLESRSASGSPPVPGSPTFNENHSMLANMASPPTRPSGESQKTDSSSSSSNGGLTQPRSHSPGSYSPPSGNSQDNTPLEAGPSHLPYRKPRTLSTRSMTSSPLNPTTQLAHQPSPYAGAFPRPVSEFMRIPSEESRALAGKGSLSKLSDASGSATPNRGSMILYRYAFEDGTLVPPTMPACSNRDSIASFASLSSDSKYPMGSLNSERGLIAYAYDPELDELDPADEADRLHDPETPDEKLRVGGHSWRGTLNIGTLVLLVLGLLALFVCFPVYSFYRDNGTNALIVGNTRINSTGQADG